MIMLTSLLLPQKMASGGTPLPHPVSVTHALPPRLLEWKGLVNYVDSQKPKITPRTSQENTLLPRPCPLPTSYAIPGAWYEIIEQESGCVSGQLSPSGRSLKYSLDRAGKRAFGCPLEDERAASSRQIVMGSFSLKMKSRAWCTCR